MFKYQLKPTIYEFDRRQFLKYTGIAGVGATFVNVEQLYAAGECEKKEETVNASGDNSYLNYWIDGIHFNDGLSDIPSRANMAFFLNLPQTASKYVERVVLTDQNNIPMGARYYEYNDRLQTGQPPYAIFHNLRINYTDQFFIYYHVREGNTKLTVYKYTLTNARRSVFNFTFLPQSMRSDFQNQFMGQNPGFPSCPYQFYTENGIGLHTARGHVIEINSDNSFKIDVELMHADLNANHYMRYFIITDPVGRLLGYDKRTYNPSTPSAGTGGSYSSQTSMQISALTPQKIADEQIAQINVAHINDCPYIKIITEDYFDALAVNTLHLR